MKRTIMSVCLALAAVSVSAQQQGDIFVSGSLSFNGGTSIHKISGSTQTTTVKTPASSSFSLMPQAGYFLTDNLELNFQLGYSFAKTLTDDDPVLCSRVNQFVLGPGAAYHFPITDKFSFRPGVELMLGFGGANADISENRREKLGSTFTFGLHLDLLAFEFRPSGRFGIILKAGGLNFETYQLKLKQENLTYLTRTNSFDFGLNLTTSLGFRYYL